MLMKYRLFTPGPTSVPEATLIELAKPVHHHRTGEFRALFNEIQSLLQYVFQTKQQVYTITGSGTAAAEAGIVNTLAPGQRALVVTNGKFAERWSNVCTAFGIEHKDIKLEYGDHVSPEQISSELRASKYDAVILVHSETSTATVCNLEQIGRAVRTTGETLLIVDGSRLAGIFTERDYLDKLALGEARSRSGLGLDSPVDGMMTVSPRTLSPDHTLGDAVRLMTEGGYRHIPLVESDGRIFGLVGASDLVVFIAEHFPAEVYNLPPRLHQAIRTKEGG